jgi:dynein heavy chain
MASGHAMLVGGGGSGKRSLTPRASTILVHGIIEVAPRGNYSTNDFLGDLRELYRWADVLTKPITFVFTDNGVKGEGFLEFINSMLMTGEISGLGSTLWRH